MPPTPDMPPAGETLRYGDAPAAEEAEERVELPAEDLWSSLKALWIGAEETAADRPPGEALDPVWPLG